MVVVVIVVVVVDVVAAAAVAECPIVGYPDSSPRDPSMYCQCVSIGLRETAGWYHSGEHPIEALT